jgi:hypothetical protein
MEINGISLHHLHRFYLLEPCFFSNLVFPFARVILQVPCICYIAHIPDFVAKMFQVTEYHVKGQKSTAIAQVYIAVDRGATYVHPYMPVIDGYKDFFGTGKGIMKF